MRVRIMDKAKLEEELKREYVQVRVPDKIKLAAYLEEAKGPDRTMKQFAKACNVSAATLSRIANYKVVKPVNKDLIGEIVKNDASGYLDFEFLMRFNGMIPKEKWEKNRESLDEETIREIEKERSDDITAKNIIVSELYKRRMIQAYERLSVALGGRRIATVYGLNVTSSFAVRVNGAEPSVWNFIMEGTKCAKRIRTAEERDREEGTDGERVKKIRESVLRGIMGMYADLFLKDIWEPETLEEVKNSIVFSDPVAMEIFLEALKEKKVHSWISLILVDVEQDVVVDEVFLPREDGREPGLSIFKENAPQDFGEDDPDDEDWD